jgi:hypothetical protein
MANLRDKIGTAQIVPKAVIKKAANQQKNDSKKASK